MHAEDTRSHVLLSRETLPGSMNCELEAEIRGASDGERERELMHRLARFIGIGKEKVLEVSG